MNITKEKMLERIREWKGAFDTHPDKMDEWSLCFMEDYKVYDAIRSLIEKSGKIITLNLKTGETKTTWEPAAKTLIESSGDKDKLRGSSNVGIERKPDGPGSSPGPRSSPLPDEVEEAIHTIGLYIADDELKSNAQAALAVIRAALKCREENDKK